MTSAPCRSVILSAASNCALASAAACRPSAAAINPSATLRIRRMPLASGERSSPATPPGGARRGGRPAAPSRSPARSASRDAWIASGSTMSIRSAIRRFARQQDRFGLEGRIERVRLQRRADRANHGLGIDRFAARAGDQRRHHQFLHRLVARERIGIGLRQPLQLVRPPLGVMHHRRREIRG